MATFKVGFSRVDITPPLGVPIAGYFVKRIADGVLDNLDCNCIAVADGEKTALLYSLDLISINQKTDDGYRAAISKATGVPTRKATSILALVAPLLLSLLGKQNSQSGGSGLGSLLGGLLGGGSSQQSNVQESAGLLSGLFSAAGADQDDGNQGGFLNSILNLFH